MRSMNAISALCLTIALLASCAGSGTTTEAGEGSRAVRSLSAAEYYEKVHAAWLGQAVAGLWE